MVPSDSTPGVEYKCSAKVCSCASFLFGRVRDPKFRCKHMIRKFPPMVMCRVCGLNPAIDLPVCVSCGDADPVHARHLALSVAPKCPGFLKQHAPQDGLVYFWCSACDCEAA